MLVVLAVGSGSGMLVGVAVNVGVGVVRAIWATLPSPTERNGAGRAVGSGVVTNSKISSGKRTRICPGNASMICGIKNHAKTDATNRIPIKPSKILGPDFMPLLYRFETENRRRTLGSPQERLSGGYSVARGVQVELPH